MNGLLGQLTSLAMAERVVALQDRAEEVKKKGDFEGSVSGNWKGIDTSGAGLVQYKGKTYKTKRLGFTSLFKNSKVQLSYIDGIYYSSW